MGQDIINNDKVFTAAINMCCREFNNWSRYMGVPKYDLQLANRLSQTNNHLHLKLNFSTFDTEVFVPLDYFSDVGEHIFRFPAFERCLQKQEIKVLTLDRLLQLIKCALADTTGQLAKEKSIDIAALAHTFTVSKKYHSITNSITIGSLEEVLNSVDEVSAEPLVVFCIKSFAACSGLPISQATTEWFGKYIDILFRENLDSLLILDAFYRPSKVEQTHSRKEYTVDEWIEQTLINHLFPLMAQIGKAKLVEEKKLLTIVYSQINRTAENKDSLFAKSVIRLRHFRIKGKFFGDAVCYYRFIPNVLHEVFREDVLLNPAWSAPLYFKVYSAEQVTVTIRPFDIDRDLEMVHQWFNEEHAKAIWKMDWPLQELEHFYRTMLAEKWSHAFIGEINGIPTFNFEVYWATRDIVGDYFDVLPSDYGTHLFIAPTDKQKKFPSITTQSIVDWLFAQPKVGRLVGEGAVESMAALMNKIHVGFRLQGIIEMPHKKAYLNFCYREWYWEKFPQNRLDSTEHATKASILSK